MITSNNSNVDIASLSDKKLMYEFAKEMNFDARKQGRKSTREKIIIKSLKSPGSMVSASGVSKTIFLPSNPDELGNRIRLSLQEKQAGNNFNIINEEIVVIVDKLLEYKCISNKQYKQLLIKINLLHEKNEVYLLK